MVDSSNKPLYLLTTIVRRTFAADELLMPLASFQMDVIVSDVQSSESLRAARLVYDLRLLLLDLTYLDAFSQISYGPQTLRCQVDSELEVIESEESRPKREGLSR